MQAELLALEDRPDEFLPGATAASDRALIGLDQHGVLERQLADAAAPRRSEVRILSAPPAARERLRNQSFEQLSDLDSMVSPGGNTRKGMKKAPNGFAPSSRPTRPESPYSSLI